MTIVRVEGVFSGCLYRTDPVRTTGNQNRRRASAIRSLHCADWVDPFSCQRQWLPMCLTHAETVRESVNDGELGVIWPSVTVDITDFHIGSPLFNGACVELLSGPLELLRTTCRVISHFSIAREFYRVELDQPISSMRDRSMPRTGGVRWSASIAFLISNNEPCHKRTRVIAAAKHTLLSKLFIVLERSSFSALTHDPIPVGLHPDAGGRYLRRTNRRAPQAAASLFNSVFRCGFWQLQL
jgi:hypothetical protein